MCSTSERAAGEVICLDETAVADVNERQRCLEESENGSVERVEPPIEEVIRHNVNRRVTKSGKVRRLNQRERRQKHKAEHLANLAMLANSSREQQIQRAGPSGGNNASNEEHRPSDVVEPVIDETSPADTNEDPEDGLLERAAPAVGEAIRRNENGVLTASQIRKKNKRRQRWIKKKEAKRLAILSSLSEYLTEEQRQRGGLRS